MSFCRGCGADLAPGVIACAHCGAVAPRVATPAPPAAAPAAPARVAKPRREWPPRARRVAMLALWGAPASLVILIVGTLLTGASFVREMVFAVLVVGGVAGGLAWSIRRGATWGRVVTFVVASGWSVALWPGVVQSIEFMRMLPVYGDGLRVTLVATFAMTVIQFALGVTVAIAVAWRGLPKA